MTGQGGAERGGLGPVVNPAVSFFAQAAFCPQSALAQIRVIPREVPLHRQVGL
jgi:hypothetical protein